MRRFQKLLANRAPIELVKKQAKRDTQMGFISDLARNKNTISDAGDRSRRMWRQVFSGTNKEDSNQQPPVRPVAGGGWSRGSISEPAAMKRLLQAMRSMAPGSWSQNYFENQAHWNGIQYIAGHRLCTMMQQAEFQVFEKDKKHPDGKRAVHSAEGERLIRVLEHPNPQDSFGKWMYRLYQQKLLTGTALDWLVPNALGEPHEHYIIPTAIAIPQPAINPDYPDGYYRVQPVYPYGPFSSYPTPATAVGAPIPAQWMLRFQYPHPLLRYEGFAPLTGLQLHIDEVEMIDKSRHYSMQREFNPSAVLSMENVEGMEPWFEAEIERMKADFENEHQSPEQAGRLFIPPPGGKLEPFGSTNKEMEYHQSWSQLVDFVLAGFGITKPAAGMVEDASYSTLFATLKQLYLITLQPECDDIASELTRHLAPMFARDLIIEIRCKRIDDHELLFQKITHGMGAKAITKNEVRKMLDLPITREEWGEEIAGTDSAEEGLPGGAPGLPGGIGGGDIGDIGGPPGGAPGEGEALGEEGTPEGAEQEPGEISGSRPVTGDLGAGAKGPEKHLTQSLNKRLSYLRKKGLKKIGITDKELEHVEKKAQKSIYTQVREICANGTT